MSELATPITRVAGGAFPGDVSFDMSTLQFIRPAGVCFPE